MPDSTHHLMRRVESALAMALGRPINIDDAVALDSPHVVLRCSIKGATNPPSSVVVKQVTSSEFTEPDRSGTSHRLLNEWATLRFLEALPGSEATETAWPRLLAASSEDSFVVIEDLGSHPTVEDMLFSTDHNGAAASLAALGSSLGRLHESTRQRASAFAASQAELDAMSPRSDSTFDVRSSLDDFIDCFTVLGITPHEDFWPSVEELETTIHTPGAFHGLIHADAGPQNFLWTGQGARIIDYEFASFGNGMLDLVSARLGFPHSDKSRTVPIRLVEEVEQSYRNSVGASIPAVDDDAAFVDGVTAACAHWALVRWIVRWRRLFRDGAGGPVDAQKEQDQSQAFTVYLRFLATARASGSWEPIARTVETYCNALQSRHPDLVETSPYPALDPRM